VKVTKKQIKEDKFMTTTAKISIFITENWKKITVIGVAVVIVIGAIVAFSQYVSWKNDKASGLLSEALKLYDEAAQAVEKDGRVPSSLSKYETARAKFQESYQQGGNKSTNFEALFYSAKCYYEAGNYNGAIAEFEKITGSKGLLALSAREGIAKSYEQIGDDASLRKAIQVYDELSKYPESYITVRSLMNKGICHEKLGEKDQAVASYKAIIDKFKVKLAASVQEKSKVLVQKAKDVISKYESALGKDKSDSKFTSLISQADALEASKQEQWFDILNLYDKAIFSKNEYWYQQKSSDETAKPLQEAEKVRREYEDESMNFIKNMILGRQYQEQNDWDNAIRYYNQAVRFDFLPDMDLYEEAKLHLSWLSPEGKK